MKFGIFYEHQLPRPWGEGARAAALSGGARPGGARRPARHRLRLGGRAPLSRGVLALAGAGGLPRRLLAAHQAHPARARHRADAAAVQSSGQGRRAHRHARPRFQRPGRLRHRRVGLARRAGGLRHRPGAEARHVARGHRAGREHARDGPVPRLPGQVLLDAVPQRGAEAGAEAASADVARVLDPRDHPRRRAARPRRAHLRLRRSRPRRGTGSTTTTAPSSASACRSATRSTRTSRWSPASPVTRTPRRRAAAASTAFASSASRSPTTTCSAPTSRGGRTSGRASRRCAMRCPTSAATAASARPTSCAQHLHKFADVGVDQVIFIQQGGRNRHEHICESLELFAARRHAGVQGARGRARARARWSASRRRSRRRWRARSSCRRSPTRTFPSSAPTAAPSSTPAGRRAQGAGLTIPREDPARRQG